jgi:hypothetical protein
VKKQRVDRRNKWLEKAKQWQPMEMDLGVGFET